MRAVKMILALGLLLGSVSASAMSYERYTGLKEVANQGTMEAVTLHAYLAGLTNTYTDANFSLQKKGKAPLFCQPEQLSLNHDTVTDILEAKAEKAVQNGAKVDTASVSTLLLEGLRDTFPCT